MADLLRTALAALAVQTRDRLAVTPCYGKAAAAHFPVRSRRTKPTEAEIPHLREERNAGVSIRWPRVAPAARRRPSSALGARARFPRAPAQPSPSTKPKIPLQMTPSLCLEEKICDGVGPGFFTRLK